MLKREFDRNGIEHLVEQYEEMLSSNSNLFFEQESFEKLIDFYQHKEELGKALQVTEIASSQHPFSAIILTKKAELLFDLEQHDLALGLLEKAEIFDPGDINIYLQRAEIYSWLSSYSKAIEQLKKAESTADGDELDVLYLEFSDIYDDWGKFNKAFKYIRKALMANPKNKEALSRLNFFTDLLRNYDRAIGIYTFVINNNPYSFHAWNQLGVAYQKIGALEKAVDAFEYAIAIDDSDSAPHISKAESLFDAGLYEKAIDAYQDALVVAKAENTIDFNIGLCFEKLKKFAKARTHFQKAVHHAPNFDYGFFKIGKTYLEESQWAKAISSFNKAISIDENNPKYLTGLARASYQFKDYENAILAFDKALELEPNSKKNWIGLAKCFFSIDDHEEAVSCLDTALQHFESDIELTYIKSAYLINCGRKNEGIIELEKSLAYNFDKHYVLFEIVPDLTDNEHVLSIIEQHKQ